MNVVLYCPHLGRDRSRLFAAVPILLTYVGQPTLKGEDGCLQGHKDIVAAAALLRQEFVFVMEDDCEFTPHFTYRRWCNQIEYARVNGYDVLIGGSTRTYEEKLIQFHEGSALIKVEAFHSAHCVAYLPSGYEKVQRAKQPYDFSLGRDCGMRCLLVWPFVAVQRASYSGILRTDVDYVPLYHQHERQLGRALGLMK